MSDTTPEGPANGNIRPPAYELMFNSGDRENANEPRNHLDDVESEHSEPPIDPVTRKPIEDPIMIVYHPHSKHPVEIISLFEYCR